jgi:hypothetical protein
MMMKSMWTVLFGALILFGVVAAVSQPAVALASDCNGFADPICEVSTRQSCKRYGYCAFTYPTIGIVPCCYESETSTTYFYYPSAM